MTHTLTCTACGHTTRVREPFTHLSLQLPDSSPGALHKAPLQQLLARHFHVSMYIPYGVCSTPQWRAMGRDAHMPAYDLVPARRVTPAVYVCMHVTGSVVRMVGSMCVYGMHTAHRDLVALKTLTCVRVHACVHACVQEEDLDKACEGCGAACVRHRMTHVLSRLPRVLVIHLKRFNLTAEVAHRVSACLSAINEDVLTTSINSAL